MKNQKNIVLMLVVLILIVSTIVMFVGCTHKGDSSAEQGSLIGVWEVKKITDFTGDSEIYPKDSEFNSNGEMEKTVIYVFFTQDNKFGYRSISFRNAQCTSVTRVDLKYQVKGKNINIGSETASFSVNDDKLTIKGHVLVFNGSIELTKSHLSVDYVKDICIGQPFPLE